MSFNIINKIIGAVLCIVGIVIWFIDFLIFTAIGALTAWIAGVAGITGMAVLGVQIIGWILTFSIMLLLFLGGLYVIVVGCGLILSD